MSDDDELRNRLSGAIPREPEVLGYVRALIGNRDQALRMSFGIELPKCTVTKEEPDIVKVHFDGYLLPRIVGMVGDWLYRDEDRPPPTYRYLVSWTGRDVKVDPVDPAFNPFTVQKPKLENKT